jgi:hypothetical protein
MRMSNSLRVWGNAVPQLRLRPAGDARVILQQNLRALPHGACAAPLAIRVHVRQNAGDKHGLEARNLGRNGRVRRIGVF